MVKENRQMKQYFSFCPQRFFKVFLPDKSSHRMKFPPAFLKHFSGAIPFQSTIISPAKNSWQVDLLKTSHSLYFEKGWKQFVHDNSLVFGDFLVFSYNGNAIFNVKIYGPDGCEKESTCRAEENNTAKMIDSKGHGSATISKRFEENDRSIKELNEFESDYPFFKVVMRPSYIASTNLNVPKDFIKSHLSYIYKRTAKQATTLVYSNKSWPVTLNLNKFSRGWPEFVKDTSLEEGDVCVFELVNYANRVFKVTMFRCLG